MKHLSILCVTLCVSLSTTTATFARGGGMGSHGMSATDGAFGTSPAAHGTNSLGAALSSSGSGRPMKGPLLGTNPAIDREEAKLDKMDRVDLPGLLRRLCGQSNTPHPSSRKMCFSEI